MSKETKLFSKLKQVLGWGYPGMEGYVQDILVLLIKDTDFCEIKKQIMCCDEELGLDSNTRTKQLELIILQLKDLKAEIQKYLN